MKFITPILALILPALAQNWQVLTYSKKYDNPDLPLTDVACSNGSYGLITKGYTTLGSLPTFPNIGGVYTVTGWNSPLCGTCYNVTYPVTGNSIFVLSVDSASEGLNVSEDAFYALTEDKPSEFPEFMVISNQVNFPYCGVSW